MLEIVLKEFPATMLLEGEVVVAAVVIRLSLAETNANSEIIYQKVASDRV